MELKRALAKTRQDLQKTRSRRQSQDTRSSSDEVGEDNNYIMLGLSRVYFAISAAISNTSHLSFSAWSDNNRPTVLNYSKLCVASVGVLRSVRPLLPDWLLMTDEAGAGYNVTAPHRSCVTPPLDNKTITIITSHQQNRAKPFL